MFIAFGGRDAIMTTATKLRQERPSGTGLSAEAYAARLRTPGSSRAGLRPTRQAGTRRSQGYTEKGLSPIMIGALCCFSVVALAAGQEVAADRSERAARAMLEERFSEAETLYRELLRRIRTTPDCC